MLFAVQEFVLFENQRLKSTRVSSPKPDLERRRAAYERLKESFGTIHCEGNWKEELYEALDEKYKRAY
jgi:hypothetical protein